MDSVLFPIRLRAHILAHAGKFARWRVWLFEHLCGVQSLQLLVHSEAHLATKEAISDEVEVLEWVILVEDYCAFDALEDIKSLADSLQLFLWDEVKL